MIVPSKPVQKAFVFREKLIQLNIDPNDIIFTITLTGSLLIGVRKKENKNEFLYFDFFGFLPSSSEIDLSNELTFANQYFHSLSDERKERFTNKNSRFFVNRAGVEFDVKNLPELLSSAQLLPGKNLN